MSNGPAVRLHGQFSDWWSVAGVSRGLACGLAQNGIEVYLHDVQRGFGPTLDVEGLWATEGVYLGHPPEDVDIGLFVGYPPFSTPWLDAYKTKIGCFIAESSVIPDDWGVIARGCDLVVVPSDWVRRTYEKSGGVPSKRLLTVLHGLDPAFVPTSYNWSLPPASKPLRFLHICGTRDFPDRKGTPQLIEAFDRACEAASHATLTVRTPPSPVLEGLVFKHGGGRIELETTIEPLPPAAMRAYLERGWAALVQPSRAEAFGLCCIEARAVGLPVICTHGTGHEEHGARSDVRISHGAEAPIVVNGIPGGRAPTVTVDAIVHALKCFARGRGAFQTDAIELQQNGYYDRWSWSTVTRPLAAWLRERTLAPPAALRDERDACDEMLAKAAEPVTR